MSKFVRDKNKKTGVDDMVLLTKLTEDDIMQNLKKRYSADLIYTYIGPVLISVNPFQKLPIYGPEIIEEYKHAFRYENPPHAYAIAEAAYRSIVTERENQCIIISGESGAGKTEAAKLIMQYIAAVSGNSADVEKIKSIILESNPLLEAFGNAKTLRNNNSSRFGKYFEIAFDEKGDPEGGKITNYLLEKSRVVYQTKGERNFHVFYQFCAGATAEERENYGIQSANDFLYLNQSGCLEVDGMDDAQEFSEVRKAMDVMGMPKEEQSEIFQVIAGILWLGNISFVEDGNGAAKISDQNTLAWASNLLNVETIALQMALTYRTITTGVAGGGKRSSTYNVPQNAQQAASIRDALAKAIYDRLFDHIIQRVNDALEKHNKNSKKQNPLVIGVLDIYGFEIFEKNGFEQFCINYVNEKLQQIFIELTLKAEQDEYVNEGIAWTPIKFFNNKIVCDLIEEKRPPGIFAILDDVCHTVHSMDSSKADEKLCQKLSENFGSHLHFASRNLQFLIKHYAGDVMYDSDGYTEKNRDELYKTLVECMKSSKSAFLRARFPEEVSADDKKRPTTAGFKIRNSAAALVTKLMACTPHYIRCIKPNENKAAHDHDDKRVLHQVKYLGLLENVRVRRAGFAFRREYPRFLDRYNVLSSKTWPDPWKGDPKGGCTALLEDLKINQDQWQCGKTKMFIKSPETFFQLEELRERKYADAANNISRCWRSYMLRKYYMELRAAATELLAGRKERRRLSINRLFMGDYINYLENAQLQEVMTTKKGERITFADLFAIPTKKGGLGGGLKLEKAFTLLSDQAIYFVQRVKDKKSKQFVMQLTRRIDLNTIGSVSLSQLADNYVVIHITGTGVEDMICECEKKTEFVTILNDLMKSKVGKPLTLNCTNQVQFNGAKGKKGVIEFKKDPTGQKKLALLSGSLAKAVVTIAEGLPASTKPKAVAMPTSTTSSKSSAGAAPGYGGGMQSTPSSHYQESASSKGGAASGGAPAATAAAASRTPAYGGAGAGARPGGAAAAGSNARPGAAAAAAAAPPPAARPPPPKPAKPADTRPKYKVLYDYTAAGDDELTIREGEVMFLISKDASGWWEGEINGKKGLFPGNYVQGPI